MRKKILCSVAVLLLAGLSILTTAQNQAGGQQKPPLSPRSRSPRAALLCGIGRGVLAASISDGGISQ